MNNISSISRPFASQMSAANFARKAQEKLSNSIGDSANVSRDTRHSARHIPMPRRYTRERPDCLAAPVKDKIHFVYTLGHHSGKPAAKRAAQTTDGYWTSQVDRLA